jgi:hypothetical protein
MKLNARAADVLKEAEVELDSILQSAQRSPEFQRTQGAWQEYAELQARFRSEIDKPGHGSMAPMLYYGFKTELIRLRIKELSPKPEGQW